MIDIDYKPFLKYLYLEVEIEKYKKYQHEIKKDSYKSKEKKTTTMLFYIQCTQIVQATALWECNGAWKKNRKSLMKEKSIFHDVLM